MKTRRLIIPTIIFITFVGFLFSEQAKEPSREYRSVTELIARFKSMTKVQQNRWNEENEWKYLVKGTGRISEVGESGIFAEIECNCYEMSVELPDGNRAIVFYPKTEEYEWVAELEKNAKITFKGKLKKLIDWEFWVSAYIQ